MTTGAEFKKMLLENETGYDSGCGLFTQLPDNFVVVCTEDDDDKLALEISEEFWTEGVIPADRWLTRFFKGHEVLVSADMIFCAAMPRETYNALMKA